MEFWFYKGLLFILFTYNNLTGFDLRRSSSVSDTGTSIRPGNRHSSKTSLSESHKTVLCIFCVINQQSRRNNKTFYMSKNPLLNLFLFIPHTRKLNDCSCPWWLLLITVMFKLLLNCLWCTVNLEADVETGTMLDVSPALFIWTLLYCMCVNVLSSCTRTQQLLHRSALINTRVFDLLIFTLTLSSSVSVILNHFWSLPPLNHLQFAQLKAEWNYISENILWL